MFSGIFLGMDFSRIAKLARGSAMRSARLSVAVVAFMAAVGQAASAQEVSSDADVCNHSSANAEAAIPACTRLIETGGTPAAIAATYNNRGIAFAVRGLLDDALNDFSAAIARQPTFSEALKNRGIIFHRRGEFDRALADLNMVVRNNPNAAPMLNARGAVWLDKQEFTLAQGDFTRAIQKDPKFALAYNNRGLASWYMRKLNDAIKDFDAFINLKPNEPSGYLNRASVYMDKGEYRKAIEDLSAVISRNDQSAKSYSVRGEAWRLSGELDKAKSDADEAIRLDAANPENYNNRALILKDQGNLEAAIADLDEAILREPRHDMAYANRGDIKRQMLNFDGAVTDLDRALSINPNSPVALIYRGNALRERGELDKALADFTRALKIVPDLVAGLTGRGLTFEARGERDRAEADYVKATTLPATFDGATARIAQQLASQRLAALKVEAVAAEAKLKAEQASRATMQADAKAQIEARLNAQRAPDKPPVKLSDPGRRIALVIGNSKYKNVAQLTNPRPDAEKMGAVLREVGFQSVTVALDLGRADLLKAMRTFEEEADKADWSIIYYAGHGLQLNGVNYAIPIDAMLKSDRDVPDETIPLDRMLASVQGSKKLRLVILDACRDNPFNAKMARTIATRSIGRGLAKIEELEGGSLVAFAARDGQVALDGAQGNSPFAIALAKYMREPNLELNMLFRRVRDEVIRTTGKQQEPWVYGTLPATEFYFLQQ